MAQIAINQETARIMILIAGSPVRAEQYENRGTEASPDWQKTGQMKSDRDGLPVWNIPATIIVAGSAAPLATKLTIASKDAPQVPPVGTMVHAEGLMLGVFSPQVSAQSLRPLAPAMPENGGK
ncbi:hypothetical protein D4R08_07885 [Corynebacterium xerosis]|uniref:hypothetical protein n=1 Tax=Corynebacterium xerosis TaxID=1725 RepID=UPI000EAF5C2C|nr:hypothetical protein [Corynebacterium xerosis]AYJ33227.1 hypothetical protein D4R08_07885 [Corynebacterium xerosis]